MKTLTRAGLAGLFALTVLAAGARAETSKPTATPAPPAGAAAPTGKAPWGPASVTPGELDAAQSAMIKTINAYFNKIDSLKGAFVQTGSDHKRLKGKFAMKRPGRFRFDYALPSKQIIVSDGEYLAIQDLDLNNEDRIALDQTPFRLLLRKDVDLVRDAKIIDLQQADDLIILTMQDKNPDVPGRIKIFMATKPAVELKEWVTTDAQGGDTHVEVADLVHSDSLDLALFKIEPVGAKTIGRPN